MKNLSKYARHRVQKMMKENFTTEEIATATGLPIHSVLKVKLPTHKPISNATQSSNPHDKSIRKA
jgi:hypothetical protein